MSAIRFRQRAAGNIRDSIETERHGASPAPGPQAVNPYLGLDRVRGAVVIPLERLERDEGQPREEFDEEGLQRLADSLRERGQLQPIRVRPGERGDSFVILCGERRWRAARLAGLPSLACIIHQGEMTREERLGIQLTENALREDLRPIEQARAYRDLMAATGMSKTDLARHLHVSQAAVTKAVALLELPPSVQERVDRGEIGPTHAYAISQAHPDDQEEIAERAISRRMTREEVTSEVRRRIPESKPSKRVKTKVFRTRAGPKITLEWNKGLDPPTMIRALEEAIASLR